MSFLHRLELRERERVDASHVAKLPLEFAHPGHRGGRLVERRAGCCHGRLGIDIELAAERLDELFDPHPQFCCGRAHLLQFVSNGLEITFELASPPAQRLQLVVVDPFAVALKPSLGPQHRQHALQVIQTVGDEGVQGFQRHRETLLIGSSILGRRPLGGVPLEPGLDLLETSGGHLSSLGEPGGPPVHLGTPCQDRLIAGSEILLGLHPTTGDLLRSTFRLLEVREVLAQHLDARRDPGEFVLQLGELGVGCFGLGTPILIVAFDPFRCGPFARDVVERPLHVTLSLHQRLTCGFALVRGVPGRRTAPLSLFGSAAASSRACSSAAPVAPAPAVATRHPVGANRSPSRVTTRAPGDSVTTSRADCQSSATATAPTRTSSNESIPGRVERTWSRNRTRPGRTWSPAVGRPSDPMVRMAPFT